eukprot:COSAG02_NODE_10477_length_1933_cov_1.840785_3_plen_54_part_00
MAAGGDGLEHLHGDTDADADAYAVGAAAAAADDDDYAVSFSTRQPCDPSSLLP